MRSRTYVQTAGKQTQITFMMAKNKNAKNVTTNQPPILAKTKESKPLNSSVAVVNTVDMINATQH